MRKSVVALALVLRRRPRHRRARRSAAAADARRQGRDHRRGDPRRDGRLPRRRRRGLRRGDQVHPERRQGLQPERDVVEGQGRRGRRIDRHLHGPRQRLAQPVHLRPDLHDQGRLRPQRHGRRRRLQQQVLRRAVRRDARPRARTRSSCSTTCATRRATPSRATPSRACRSPASASTTTRPASSRPARRPSSPTATRGAESLPAGAVHDPPVDRGPVAHQPNAERQRRLVRVDADARRDRLPGSRTPRRPASTARSDRHDRRHDRRGHLGRLRRHGRRPGRPLLPGNAASEPPRASRAVRRPRTRRCRTGDDPFRPGRGCASSTRPTRPTAEGATGPGRGSRRPVDHRLRARHGPRAARQHGARRPRRSTPASAASRRTATARATRPRSTGRFTETVAWTVRVRNAARRPLFDESTGTGATFEAVWNGLVGGNPVAGRHVHRRASAASDAWDNAPASATRTVVVDTVAPQLLAGSPPTPTTTQWFSPNGDGFARHGQPDSATNSETGSLIAAHPRRRRDRGQDVQPWRTAAPPRRVTWNGRNNAGGYRAGWHLHDQRLPGRPGRQQRRGPRPDGRGHQRAALGAHLAGAFYPQDNDAWPSATLRSPLATDEVTWTLRDAAGAVVITRMDRRRPRRPGRRAGRSTAADPTARCCRAASTPRTWRPPTAS